MVSDLVRRAWADLTSPDCRKLPQPDDPVVFLARAVVAQAVIEYRLSSYLCVGSDEQPRPSAARGEIRQFWRSDWLGWWCDMADVDVDYVRQRHAEMATEEGQ